jgi:AcrR family transcriptional regulator
MSSDLEPVTHERAAVDGRPLRAPHSSEKILEAAEVLFSMSGYSGLGMRQLATTVGLSKSSLFHHFPTKLELYAAVLDRALERIELGLGSEACPAQGPAARLDEWITSIVGVLAEDAPTARLMLRALVDEEPFPALALGIDPSDREPMPFEIRLARILDRFRELLEAGIADGTFRPVSIGDAIQSTIGALVFHFASGDLGEALIGEPIFSAAAVARRRREVSEFIRRGLLA